MKITDKITITNEDNMELMKRYPDKYFDLAIVDPPYGINADKKNSKRELKSKKSASISKHYGNQQWDSDVPNEEYFKELIRVSKKQIIWGVNYYPYAELFVGGRLFWDKGVTMPTYSKGELASIKANTGRKHTKENIEKRSLKQKKINESQKEEILQLLFNGYIQKDIAKKFNVSQRVISKIKLGIY